MTAHNSPRPTPTARPVSSSSARLAATHADEPVRRSGANSYNSRTTRRTPTGSHQRIRRGGAPVAKGRMIRENTDERPRGPTGVSALITRRSQVQILSPPPSKEPGQRPFPDLREGPLTLFGARSANRMRTRLTFGTQPDGHGRFNACPGCGEFNEVWRSCSFVTLSTASARSTARLLSRDVQPEVRQTVRRFSDRHVILAAVRTLVIKGRGGAWADGTAGTLCWRSVLVTRRTSLAVGPVDDKERCR